MRRGLAAFCGSWVETLLATKSLPLASKRIVLTRTADQVQILASELKGLGAEVLDLPLLKIVDPNDWAPVDQALESVSQYDWIFFTSQNAVNSFWRRCRQRGVEPKLIKSRVAAVGAVTAKAARNRGFRVSHVATESRGIAMAKDLEAELKENRVLLPRSDRASPDLPKALVEAGAVVTEVVVYRTVQPHEVDERALEAIRAGEVDLVACFSPSAFHHLLDLGHLGQAQSLAGKLNFAAIGPVTAEAIRRAGFRVVVQAEVATIPGFIQALVRHYTTPRVPEKQAQ